MDRFDVLDLLLYIKKEEAAEYTGMGIVPGWGRPASCHESAGNQKEHGWLAKQQAPFNCFYHAQYAIAQHKPNSHQTHHYKRVLGVVINGHVNDS